MNHQSKEQYMASLAMNGQKKERDDFKKSINHWIAAVPDLSTPYYDEDDDLMAPEAYDEIRELVKELLLYSRQFASLKDMLRTHSQFSDIFHWPFYENCQIDSKLKELLTLTQIHDLYRVRETRRETPRETPPDVLCRNLRNVIETNLPFSVFYLLSHGIYEKSIALNSKTSARVMPPNQSRLLAIIINQQSKIDRLESMLLDMDSRLQSIEGTQQTADNKPQVEVKDLIYLPKNPFDDF